MVVVAGQGDADERQRIGEALSRLSEVLAPYVDAAMTEEYGEDWPEIIATKNAARRPDGRRFPISKTDPMVLLQQIAFERVAPWGGPRSDSGLIRSYASELRTVRNLWAHNGDVRGEYARFADTTRRLLAKLDLPVPASLESNEPGAVAPVLNIGVTNSTQDLRQHLIEEAVVRLGPAVRRPAELYVAWWEADEPQFRWPEDWWPGKEDRGAALDAMALLTALHSAVAEVDDIRPNQSGPAGALAHALTAMTKKAQIGLPSAFLVKLIATLPRIRRYELGMLLVRAQRGSESGHPSEEVVPPGELEGRSHERGDRDRLPDADGVDTGAETYLPRGVQADDDQFFSQLTRVLPLVESLEASVHAVVKDPARLLSEVIGLTPILPEGVSLTHDVLAKANALMSHHLVSEDSTQESALRHAREAIAHQRTLIGLLPGLDREVERRLVSLLKFEGQLCRELGLDDQAIMAFARADEIIDRYPLADPAFG